MKAEDEANLLDACEERCAKTGDRPCYELAAMEGEDFKPCTDCFNDCGLPIPPEPLDPDAVIAPLL